MYGLLFLLAPAIVKLDPDSTVCFLSCFPPSHVLTILLHVCALSVSLPPRPFYTSQSSHPGTQLSLFGSRLLHLSGYLYLKTLTVSPPPHISLLVKCHLTMPAFSTIKSHTNTRVPVKSSHPTQLHTEGEGMPFVCDLE